MSGSMTSPGSNIDLGLGSKFVIRAGPIVRCAAVEVTRDLLNMMLAGRADRPTRIDMKMV
jgi:hypothetical protein